MHRCCAGWRRTTRSSPFSPRRCAALRRRRLADVWWYRLVFVCAQAVSDAWGSDCQRTVADILRKVRNTPRSQRNRTSLQHAATLLARGATCCNDAPVGVLQSTPSAPVAISGRVLAVGARAHEAEYHGGSAPRRKNAAATRGRRGSVIPLAAAHAELAAVALVPAMQHGQVK